MIELIVLVEDLPNGFIKDDDLVAPFHTTPGVYVVAKPIEGKRRPVQKFVLDDGVDIPTVLPAAIPEDARMYVVFEIPAVWPNAGFKVWSDGYKPGNYQTILVVAAMLGCI